jgi:hypothetical protein
MSASLLAKEAQFRISATNLTILSEDWRFRFQPYKVRLLTKQFP